MNSEKNCKYIASFQSCPPNPSSTKRNDLSDFQMADRLFRYRRSW